MTQRTIAIVGGHGKIALDITRQLSARGDRTINLIRNPDHTREVEKAGGTAAIHDLEAEDVSALAGKLAGADAVVFAAGAGGGSGAARKHTVDFRGSVDSASAARQAGISRFVQISFIGAEQPTPEDSEEVFAAYWDAKREADEALRASDLQWTIIKPGGLTDDPATGTGKWANGIPRGAKTRRADVAAGILAILDNPASIGHDLDLAEGESDLVAGLEAFLGG